METPAELSISRPHTPAVTRSEPVVRRIIRGLSALSLSAVVQILGQITIVPVALYAWGKVRYGEWVLLTGLVTFLRLTDLGLQTFVVNRLCSNYAREDRAGMERELHSALRVQLPLVLVVAVLCGLMVFAFPIMQALDLQTVSQTTFSIVALLLVGELLIGVPMGVIAGAYRATGRLARAGVIGACQQLAIMTLSIAFIAGQAGFISLAAVRLAVAVAISSWILYDLRKLYPWLHLWPRKGSYNEGARMIGPGLFFLMIPLADYFSNQFTLLVLQRSLDGGEVSRLATHRTVVNMAMMASGLLTNTVWPELTALHARGRFEELRKTHRSLTRLNLWLVGVVAFGMLPFIPYVYPSWTAGRLTVDTWTLGFLMSRMVLWGAWSASMTTLCAINRQKTVAGALLLAAVLTGILSIWLIPRMGISGAAFAQLIGDLSVSAWLIPLLASREIRESYSELLLRTAAAMLKGLLIPIALGVLGWRLISSELVRLTLLVPAIACLGLVLMWRQLADYERSQVFSLLKARSRTVTNNV